MHIAVVGAGAVGSYFGGHLAHAGEDVVLIERGRTLEALGEHGLRIDDVKRSFIVHPVRATADANSVGEVDIVLLAVKGWQAAGAIETIRPLMGPHTCAIPLMDGVEAPDQLAAAYGKGRVAAGIAIMLGRSVEPGHIRNSLPHTSISIGELDVRGSERMVGLQVAFERAGVHAVISPDIVSARWEKLVLVGPWSAIGAVTRAPLGVLRTMPETRELLEGAMNEVVQVARASGAKPSDNVVAQSLAALDFAPDIALGNMRDILEGKPSELETEVGAVVRLGRKLGIEVPRHTFLYATLLPQERKAREQTKALPQPISEAKSPARVL